MPRIPAHGARRCCICGRNPGGFTAGVAPDFKTPVYACAGKHNQEAIRRGLIATPFDLRDKTMRKDVS